MKQTMLALFVLLFLCLVAPSAYCAVTPGASIFVLKPDVSFGTVAEGIWVDHTFVVENQGDAPLQILRVRSG